MADNRFLEQLSQGWQTYQAHLVRAIAPLTEEQLALQLAPELRSVRTLAAHIIAARVWWFCYVMGEGPAELEPLVRWDDEEQPARSAAELVTGLEKTWEMVTSALARWTQAELAEMVAAVDRPGAPVSRSFSRQWIVWHVLEHDLHHGGELSFALGAHRLPAIDL